MAKKKDRRNQKGKTGGKMEEGGSGSDDEGSMFNDNASMTSEASSFAPEIEDSGNNGVDESSKIEMFESKLREALELATQKSAAGRVKALEAICGAFLKRYCPDFVENQQITTCDVIEKSLKKGKGGEVAAGAKLGILLGLQLSDPEVVYKELKSLLVQMLTDKTQTPASRAAIANTLSGLCFLGGGEIAEVVSIMSTLESVFSSSYTKPDLSPEMSSLHSACLSGWALLLSLMSPGEVSKSANNYIQKFEKMLLATDVELRITAGEAIALILEFAYDYDEEFEPDNLNNLIQVLKQLATDSTKSRSKKDRKEQRSSFRDILRGVEEGDPPSEKVKFGQEVLYLDSWYKKQQYDWFCKVLGSGMNIHLSSNYLLREIFELPPPLPAFDPANSNKISKSERNAANQLAFKLRTQSRMKNRDKRSAVL